MASTVDLAGLRIGDFAPHLGAVFEMPSAGGAVSLKLSQVTPAGESGRDGGAFSLLFIAPKGPWLQQAIYPLEHPALGTMEVFLVPIGPLSDGNGYQAIFT